MVDASLDNGKYYDAPIAHTRAERSPFNLTEQIHNLLQPEDNWLVASWFSNENRDCEELRTAPINLAVG